MIDSNMFAGFLDNVRRPCVLTPRASQQSRQRYEYCILGLSYPGAGGQAYTPLSYTAELRIRSDGDTRAPY